MAYVLLHVSQLADVSMAIAFISVVATILAIAKKMRTEQKRLRVILPLIPGSLDLEMTHVEGERDRLEPPSSDHDTHKLIALYQDIDAPDVPDESVSIAVTEPFSSDPTSIPLEATDDADAPDQPDATVTNTTPDDESSSDPVGSVLDDIGDADIPDQPEDEEQ